MISNILDARLKNITHLHVGISVYQSRRNMGDKLAKKILREFSDHDIDVVIPIPDTSRTSGF